MAILWLGGVCAGIAPGVATAESVIGVFGAWTAYRGTEDGDNVCYMGSSPKKEEGDYTTRGNTYVVVTLRPSDKPHGVVTIEAGYPYKDAGEVDVAIDDDHRFSLFTRNRDDGKGDAWTHTDEDDKAMIQAMKAGYRMVVSGRSQRGTLTTDTYSLAGFTRAYGAVQNACGG